MPPLPRMATGDGSKVRRRFGAWLLVRDLAQVDVRRSWQGADSRGPTILQLLTGFHDPQGQRLAIPEVARVGQTHEVVAHATIFEAGEDLGPRHPVEVESAAGAAQASLEFGARKHSQHVRVEAGDPRTGCQDGVGEGNGR